MSRRAAADLGGRAVGDDPALAHQQQPVAALGLVHHVAGDEHGLAAVGEPVEERPQVAAQHRVEADGRLVEHQHVGVAEQRDGEAGPGALAAAEVADHLVAVARPGRRRRSASSTSRAVDAEHPGEEAQVLGDGEVVVHARGLGDVADPVAQRPVAGGLPEDLDRRRTAPAGRRPRRASAWTCRSRWGRAGR